MDDNHYDVLIVGAGIAGSALAYALSTSNPSSSRAPLRIGVLERSLAEPDRIVGELLQPGGVAALTTLGMRACLDGIDAVPVHGYCVVEAGVPVHIPYPNAAEGRSFHHGRFIQALRAKARTGKGVEMVEATASGLVECAVTGRVIGVKATRKGSEEKECFWAGLVVVADGCFSNFRGAVLGPGVARSTTKSHFVGAVLEDAVLPIDKHGTVVLVKGFGPVLLYQIAARDTRILIDVKMPLPADLKQHILTNILPQLPAAVHLPLKNAMDKERLRKMPNSFLPPVEQGAHTKEGVILLGDAWNMRHPLTGGGMTVALSDVVLLSALLSGAKDLGDWHEVSELLHTWHWKRKPLSSTINILSVALYDLFGADDEYLAVLRRGCFKYFERGGDCVEGPVSLLSGLAPAPLMLFRHFCAVAFYSIWVMFTHATPVPSSSPKAVGAVPGLDEYPALLVKALRVFWTACIVFGPLLWSELRWW
ncbi:squalene epoxidase-like protein [Athelia psychrophila]|uniref:Squalene monooxygenase n=1 Tax=Athelia psychrophila TaxID=1759441 RepID=A0A166ICW8_9AGAM|nr:squalene epoxidase-like protein [Fibularhizoctonia sp. CBS 109695]